MNSDIRTILATHQFRHCLFNGIDQRDNQPSLRLNERRPSIWQDNGNQNQGIGHGTVNREVQEETQITIGRGHGRQHQ